MIIERAGRGRDLLLLGALAVLGFGLTMLAVWPRTNNQTVQVAMPIKVETDSGSSDSPVGFGSTEQPAKADVPELPAPTLQELAADSDSGTRDEAEVLLALLGEEAVADLQL